MSIIDIYSKYLYNVL